MAQKKYRDQVVEDTIRGMLSAGYSHDDVSAIRTISNDTMDMLEKDGSITRKQSDRISQDKLVKEVKAKVKKRRYTRGYLFGEGDLKIDPYY